MRRNTGIAGHDHQLRAFVDMRPDWSYYLTLVETVECAYC